MKTLKQEHEQHQHGSAIPFENIDDPGCYIVNATGFLIRVPEDGVKPGRSPLIEIRSGEPFLVTKLSDDPYITLTRARMYAADLDLPVNF